MPFDWKFYLCQPDGKKLKVIDISDHDGVKSVTYATIIASQRFVLNLCSNRTIQQKNYKLL